MAKRARKTKTPQSKPFLSAWEKGNVSKIILLIALGLIVLLGVAYGAFTLGQKKIGKANDTVEGRFCGGIAGNLPENQCPVGYTCKLNGNYPDASGKCSKK